MVADPVVFVLNAPQITRAPFDDASQVTARSAARGADSRQEVARIIWTWNSSWSVSDRSYAAQHSLSRKAGYLSTAAYGFKRGDDFVEPALKYTARDLAGAAANDDDPGRVRPGADIAGATFYSYITYSSAWDQLTAEQRDAFKGRMPVTRTNADAPGVSGYLESDRTYSAGGRSLERASVRSYR